MREGALIGGTAGQQWSLIFTPPGKPGVELSRHDSRDEAMLAAQPHFDALTGHSGREANEDDELGWQMSHLGGTAVSAIGIYTVRPADMRRR